MFDPLKIAEYTRNVVCRDDQRKYYRFRPSRFYGGISTADCLGCCLRCVFCWSWDKVIKPDRFGKYYTPEEVARKLVSTARSKRYNQIRISGNEPTICRRHLISVLELTQKDYLFILETNGVLIGNDEQYAEDLSRFPNLYVRVSLKGTCEEEFSMLTGAIPEGFQLQLKALEYLVKYKVHTHPACMMSFSSNGNIRTLRKRLRAINPTFENLELEELILYPTVEERLKRLKIDFRTGYKPDKIPFEQI